MCKKKWIVYKIHDIPKETWCDLIITFESCKEVTLLQQATRQIVPWKEGVIQWVFGEFETKSLPDCARQQIPFLIFKCTTSFWST